MYQFMHKSTGKDSDRGCDLYFALPSTDVVTYTLHCPLQAPAPEDNLVWSSKLVLLALSFGVASGKEKCIYHII